MIRIGLFFGLLILAFLTSCKDDIKHEVPNDEIKNVKFSEVQAIFNNNCTACHNPSGKDFYAGLDLSGNSYDMIVNVNSTQRPNEFLIKPESPNESYLLRKLTGENIEGDIMPNPFAKLNEIQINRIKTWIEEGALNN